MNEDFEEEYEDDEPSALERAKDAKDKYDDIKDKYNKVKEKYNSTKNQSNQVKEARDFNKSMQNKNMARGQTPATTGTTTGTTAAGTTAAGTTAAGTVAAGTTAAGTVAAGTTAAGTVAAETVAAGTVAAGTVAAGTTAAGTAVVPMTTVAAAGGAVAAQAAIPVAGWIALIVEAVIAALIMLHKLKKKHDKKMAESGIDSKGIRGLMKAAPILFPIALIILIFIIILIFFMDSEATDKVEFMDQFTQCYISYSKPQCEDFMNTGIHVNNWGVYSGSMIKKTDMEIGNMVVEFMRVYNKRFKKDDSFITDLVNEINDPEALSLDEEDKKGPIEAMFSSFFDEISATIEEKTHGIRLAWSLFNWMRMEKKIYQGIEWKKVFNATPLGFATEGLAKVGTLFTGKPSLIEGSGFTVEAIALDFNPTNAWLPTPPGISTVDKAMELVREYIPSWMEVYNTYVITEDFELANDLYSYYTAKNINGHLKNIPLEVTLFQLVTVSRTEHVESERTIRYYMKKGDSGLQELTEAEYNEAISEGSKGFWSWLGDLLSNIVSSVGSALETIVDKVKEWIGWHINTSSSYSALVTKGHGYTYKIEQTGSIDVKPDSWKEEDAEYKERRSTVTTETIDDEEVKFYSKIFVNIDYHVEQWQNIVRITSSDVDKYEHNTRYLDAMDYVIENKDHKYVLEDLGIAGDLINNYYTTKYNISTSFVQTDEIEVGSEINTQIVQFAQQFKGKDLSYMEGIDDTGDFKSDDWCAMFVSYCMEKVGLGAIDFDGCTTFKTLSKNKVGFIDEPTSSQLKNIKPGDIVLFRYPGESTGTRNHTAIVTEVTKNASGYVTGVKTIDGNVGYGGYWKTKVTECNRSIDQIASYVSVNAVKKSVEDYGYWRNK